MSAGTAEIIQTFRHCIIIPQLAACVFKAVQLWCRRGLAEVSVAALQQLQGGLVASCGPGREKPHVFQRLQCVHPLKGLEWIQAVTLMLSSPYKWANVGVLLKARHQRVSAVHVMDFISPQVVFIPDYIHIFY